MDSPRASYGVVPCTVEIQNGPCADCKLWLAEDKMCEKRYMPNRFLACKHQKVVDASQSEEP